MKTKQTLLVILLLALLLSACVPQNGTQAAKKLTDVRLPVGYIPNVQFSPMYVAIDKGFFAEEGLNVTIDYSMENDNVALVGAGQIPFAIVSGEQVIMGRSKGLPVVYVMAWYHQFPVGVAARKEQNIHQPADLKGKKVAIPGPYGASYVGLRALLHSAGLQEKDITLDSVGFTQVETLSTGRAQAGVIYIANEPIQLEAQGYPVDVLRVSDYLNLVANGLITSEKLLQDNPDLVRAMIRGLLKGIQYTIDHPDEAYEISKKYVENLDKADEKVQKQVLATSAELWKAERMGYSNPAAWENMNRLLAEMGWIEQPVDLSKTYRNDLLPEIQK